MAIDKILISHIVAELIVICGLSFYYHKKCSSLQLQINELNSKLEKMNGINYLNTIKRHEQFESQTVQHINKLYSMLNNMSGMNNSDILRTNNDSIIRENFYSQSNESASLLSQQSVSQQAPLQKPPVSNPLMNTLSMLGPLTTMFKVVMEPKPLHPNEVFENIDIKAQLNNQQKIVEVEDDEINSETLDNELKDELNDLRSNVTSAMNTPTMTPKLALTSSMPMLDICENGVCKLNFDNNKNEESDQICLNSENKDNNITLLNIDKSEIYKEVSTDKGDKSSPLRYISQPETKRGRPKKMIVQNQ
jgi:hypothetical protein